MAPQHATIHARHREDAVKLWHMLTLVLLALLFAACGASGAQVSDVVTPQPGDRVKALVLMPLALAQEEATGYDIGARTADISRWLLQQTQLPVVGPADFSLLKSVDEAMEDIGKF